MTRGVPGLLPPRYTTHTNFCSSIACLMKRNSRRVVHLDFGLPVLGDWAVVILLSAAALTGTEAVAGGAESETAAVGDSALVLGESPTAADTGGTVTGWAQEARLVWPFAKLGRQLPSLVRLLFALFRAAAASSKHARRCLKVQKHLLPNMRLFVQLSDKTINRRGKVAIVLDEVGKSVMPALEHVVSCLPIRHRSAREKGPSFGWNLLSQVFSNYSQ